jgi:hypothetical protein
MKFFHAALHVPDLDAAIESYGRTMQLDFLAPVTRNYARLQQKNHDDAFVARISYSRQGPFYIELLESSGPGIFSGPALDRFHHFGIWAKDAMREGLKMEASGFQWEATIHADDGSTPVVFVRRDDVRVEIINESRRPALMDWIEGRAERPGPESPER